MISMDSSYRRSPGLFIILAFVFFACLWIGWRDFDPWIPQHEVRENIRFAIRWLIQVLVQYVIPGSILIFFGKEHVAKRRSNKHTPTPEA